MEFDKSKVYTALNADELKVGSKVICADSLDLLKVYVEDDVQPFTLEEVAGENYPCRFYYGDSKSYWNLAYLVSEPEEKKLKWTDLKVGDVITNGGRTAIVTEIDKENSDNAHIYAGHMWFTNYELKNWVMEVKE